VRKNLGKEKEGQGGEKDTEAEKKREKDIAGRNTVLRENGRSRWATSPL